MTKRAGPAPGLSKMGMTRDIERLTKERFDVIILGAGIHGACAARDAALRGLRVAVIDRADFGGETSHNSLKTIHGGIRYIQHLNFSRTLASIREQAIWLRTAPHLTRRLPFLMPTYGHGLRGPLAMFAGLSLYRALGWGRRRGIPPEAQIRPGRVMGPSSTRALLPDIPDAGLSGAASWDDAQIRFADRAILELVSDAADHGAVLAPYVEATEILSNNGRATGVSVRDVLTGTDHTINGAVVVNTTGPWASQLAGDLPDQNAQVSLTRSMNIVTRRKPPDFAFAIKSDEASDSKLGQTKRLFFAVPWEDCTIYGTTYGPVRPGPDRRSAQEADILAFLDDLNAAWPALRLTIDDVLYCHRGLTPAEEGSGSAGQLHDSLVIDHGAKGGLQAMISVVGVKWTTGRLVAEQAVDIVCRHLGHQASGRTSTMPLRPLKDVTYDLAGFSEDQIRQFCQTHMDLTLTLRLRDMLLRRTDDLVRGRLSPREIVIVARCMRDHLGWNETHCIEEADSLQDIWLPPHIQEVFDPEVLFGSKT